MSATGIALPELLNDIKTRVGGEFYLYYNLGQAYKYGSIGVDGNLDAQYRANASCGGNQSLPVSGFAVVRARTAIKSAIPSTWSVGANDAELPAYAPPGQSAELGLTIAVPSAANVAVVDAEAGDSADIIILPNPADDVLICFDQGLNIEVGDTQRPIGRKFEQVDHYVRVRPNNQLTLADLYVCNMKGLASLQQRQVTLKYVVYPDGGAVPSEIGYFTNVRLNIPKSIAEDPGESVKVNATGMFNEMLVFTADQ